MTQEKAKIVIEFESDDGSFKRINDNIKSGIKGLNFIK